MFFLRFLADRGYLHGIGDSNDSSLGGRVELWSTDLTPEGYRFVQYAEDRWFQRLRKGDDDTKALAFLRKWHESFLKLPAGTFEGHDGV